MTCIILPEPHHPRRKRILPVSSGHIIRQAFRMNSRMRILVSAQIDHWISEERMIDVDHVQKLLLPTDRRI